MASVVSRVLNHFIIFTVELIDYVQFRSPPSWPKRFHLSGQIVVLLVVYSSKCDFIYKGITIPVQSPVSSRIARTILIRLLIESVTANQEQQH